ncbi:hypothetical protein SRB17_63640 [Streptomyces sp. RB17]|nr:hypothetical protein [Streptomyces sp. RB17]
MPGGTGSPYSSRTSSHPLSTGWPNSGPAVSRRGSKSAEATVSAPPCRTCRVRSSALVRSASARPVSRASAEPAAGTSRGTAPSQPSAATAPASSSSVATRTVTQCSARVRGRTDASSPGVRTAAAPVVRAAGSGPYDVWTGPACRIRSLSSTPCSSTSRPTWFASVSWSSSRAGVPSGPGTAQAGASGSGVLSTGATGCSGEGAGVEAEGAGVVVLLVGEDDVGRRREVAGVQRGNTAAPARHTPMTAAARSRPVCERRPTPVSRPTPAS